MFKKYGYLGIILILFAQLNFLFKIKPFDLWYVPIVWSGYILLVDAIVFSLSKKSLISTYPKKFWLVVLLSIPLWSVFEWYNLFIQNWYYTNYTFLVHVADFTIIFPAVLETYFLLKAVRIFEKVKLKQKYEVSPRLITLMILFGILSCILPLIFPKYTFYLVWVAFFLLLDPINYVLGNPSIIKHLHDGKMNIPLCLFFGAMICGIFWEFWNFWAYPKWFYEIPFISFLKIFEMPILGFIGYGPFGWEVYAMYNFVAGLFSKKEDIE
ncbi:MAG: hypothetical protein WCV90_05975 [Candidatus Woesearchaeota archaeon]|jgi:hypothetical protein